MNKIVGLGLFQGIDAKYYHLSFLEYKSKIMYLQDHLSVHRAARISKSLNHCGTGTRSRKELSTTVCGSQVLISFQLVFSFHGTSTAICC